MRGVLKQMGLDATFWLVLFFILVSTSAAYLISIDFRHKARMADLATAATAQSDLLSAARSYYSREVVDKLYASQDVDVSHNYHQRELTIPTPVSMTLALEGELERLGSESAIRMLSAYPWPWRKDRTLDAFEREALESIIENPDQIFTALEQREDGSYFRSASAVRMDESCVACHNTHPQSPRTDWEVGDIRGIQEVILPANNFQGGGISSINRLLILLLVVFAAALALTLVLSSQRRRAVSELSKLAAEERRKNEELQLATQRAEAGEAQVSAILKTMLDGVFSVSRSGAIASANEAAQQMFGVPKDNDLYALRICDLFPETENSDLPFDCCVASEDGLAITGTSQRFETVGRRMDGAEFPVELSLTKTVNGDDGTYAAIVRDLTQQKASAEKLKQAETRLIDAIESLPDGFVLYDAEDRLVLCNSKYKEFYSASADLITPGRTFEEIIRGGAQRGQYQVSAQILEDWVALRMEHHRNPGTPMEQHLDDGRWLRVIETRTSEGGLVGFRVDITELKRREKELIHSQSLMRNIVAASFDGIIVMDGQGTVVDFSPAAEEVFGWKAEEIIGHKMSDYIIPQKYRVAHDRGLEQFLKTGKGPVLGKRIEIEGLHKDGHEITVELAIRHTRGERNPFFLGYVRDITERKAADDALREAKERAEEANAAKAKFLAMMSHEIRTPMNGVLGILSLLRDTELDPKQSAYVKTARDSGRSLLGLINDILDFSKLEAGRMELEQAPFRIKTVVTSIADLFRPTAQEKDLAFSVVYAGDLPEMVVGDAGRLRQVLLNLVSNALKFTEAGSVGLNIAIEKDDADRRTYCFSIADTGIGIAPDKHEMLFGDFVTVDGSYTKKQGGTGLGLAICRQIAHIMEGEITVESAPGIGSTFRFFVPFATCEDPGPAAEQREDMPAQGLPKGLVILLAEDNVTNQIVVNHALDGAGCNVDIANNGREACQAAEKRDYDCILMDVSMPEMDGLEATRRIRSGKRNARTPIIALTAYALRGDETKFLSAGMDAYLSKPVEKEDLLASVASAIKGKSGRPEGVDPVKSPAMLAETREIIATMPLELKVKLLQQFIEDARNLTRAAELAAENDDLVALERATHALKSAAATFGATELTVAAAELNAMALDKKSLEVLGKLDELSATCGNTVREVEELAEEIGIDISLAP